MFQMMLSEPAHHLKLSPIPYVLKCPVQCVYRVLFSSGKSGMPWLTCVFSESGQREAEISTRPQPQNPETVTRYSSCSLL